jgi:hypothetical protein
MPFFDFELQYCIFKHIGKTPVIAVGNSGGDLQMLEFVNDNNQGKSLEILVHHDDAVREFSYDKGTENILNQSKQHKSKVTFCLFTPDSVITIN